MDKSRERTLVILKPDAILRNLLGNVVTRFENKGLKIVALKMMHLDDVLLSEHYSHHKEKPFFKDLTNYMKMSPVVIMCLEGLEAIKVVRLMCGPTLAREAAPGTIRGDLSLSISSNIIHASDSEENAKAEIKRFFKDDEICSYERHDYELIYSNDEK